jgi:hypothetical protein
VDVGFYVGIDASSGSGTLVNDSHTQIFINGVGLLSGGPINFPPGGSPADFTLIDASFDTGSSTRITVTYAINGGGSVRAGLSLDDFFFTAQSAVPEPPSLLMA